MSDQAVSAPTLAERIETVEEAYEFMLAYAAQGVVVETIVGGENIRAFLQRLEGALDGLAETAAQDWPSDRAQSAGAFLQVLAADAARALAVVRLVLGCPSIGSQMIDNLNASIHLRTLLTDLFLLDEVAKPA